MVRFIASENRNSTEHHKDSPHKWPIDHHVGPVFVSMVNNFSEAKKQNLLPAGNPVHLVYVLLGSVTTFSGSGDMQLLTGCDTRDPQEVEPLLTE